MEKETKRGYSPKDEKEFKGTSLEKLSRAALDFHYLLNRGYQAKGASTFIGDHYLLSERQRLAMVRTISSDSDIIRRKKKEIRINDEAPAGDVLPAGNSQRVTESNIDGFNTIITLEVALSGSPYLKCMDGTIRDLAGLRGTYRIIDKTGTAVELILQQLTLLNIRKANFYLDAPVSNSGRLKAFIAELAERANFEAKIEVIDNVDQILQKLPNVVTSDAIILDNCESWINLNSVIIEKIRGKWEVNILPSDQN